VKDVVKMHQAMKSPTTVLRMGKVGSSTVIASMQKWRNGEMAKFSGVDGFDNTRLQPIGIADCTGAMHLFHFATRLLGNMVTLEAFEVQYGQSTGYQFQMIGDPEEDIFALLGRIVDRIRKVLAFKHINDAGDGHGLQIIDRTVRGRIECGNSEEGDSAPSFVIDGKEVSWQELGQMLSSFEGWQFKLETRDRSEGV
jgi:hypothetical protein